MQPILVAHRVDGHGLLEAAHHNATVDLRRSSCYRTRIATFAGSILARINARLPGRVVRRRVQLRDLLPGGVVQISAG